tara:strand:- start:215 stop:466 length:252 start_codon:yes stop_codon:yes gene_type:complete
MKSIVINHTQNLFKAAIATAQRCNVRTIPYPKNNFKTDKDVKQYLNNLTNFIIQPELFYMNKNMHNIAIKNNTKLSKSLFSSI